MRTSAAIDDYISDHFDLNRKTSTFRILANFEERKTELPVSFVGRADAPVRAAGLR
jgi:hypothetical protein